MDGPHILVPTDFSPCASYALTVADEWADARGGHLLILHVHTLVESAVMDFSFAQPNEQPRRVLQDLTEQLRLWSQNVRTPAARVRREVVVGVPVQQIVAFSKQADLAVLGTHGRSGVGLFLLGSVTEKVVRGAHCSVYVAKQKDPANVG